MVSHGNLTCSLLMDKTTVELLADFLYPEFSFLIGTEKLI